MFLFPPAEYQLGFSTRGWDRRPGGALELGRVEIPEGEVVERNFDLSGEFPGRVRITSVGRS